MAIFSRVILTDSKPAIQIDGLPNSPVFVRARKITDSLIRGDSGRQDWALTIQVYQVDSNGNPVLDVQGRPIEAPAISRFVNMAAVADGRLTIAGEKQALKNEAMEDFINYFQGRSVIGTIPSEVIE